MKTQRRRPAFRKARPQGRDRRNLVGPPAAAIIRDMGTAAPPPERREPILAAGPPLGRAGMAGRLRGWAALIKRDVHALYLAARDPRVPWYAKALAAVVAGYALSPIDLIPDFIPVLGYLDDVILVPLGIVLVVRLIPPE